MTLETKEKNLKITGFCIVGMLYLDGVMLSVGAIKTVMQTWITVLRAMNMVVLGMVRTVGAWCDGSRRVLMDKIGCNFGGELVLDLARSTVSLAEFPRLNVCNCFVTTARELDDMGVYWLEEPLNRFAYDDLSRVREQLKRMHLAGGEGNMGLRDFREMLTKGAYSYVQPDPVVSGPLSVVRKIASMAEAFGVLFGPHHGKSGVGMMANLHMQCAAPNSGFLEYMYDPGFWNPEGFQAGFAQPYPIDKEGFIHAPAAPGLGIEPLAPGFDGDYLKDRARGRRCSSVGCRVIVISCSRNGKRRRLDGLGGRS